MYQKVKRKIDIILSIVLLIILLMPIIIIGIIIKITDKGKIIYKSKRTGQNGKIFNMYKFRTMKNEKITKIGKKLRKTGLDEIPQLINILKGEMSFIGPRPWIPEYYNAMTDEQKQRTKVLPGITGYAQIKSNEKTSILTKIEYDIYYVKNISFLLDIKILLKQIKTLLIGKKEDYSQAKIQKEIEILKKSYK